MARWRHPFPEEPRPLHSAADETFQRLEDIEEALRDLYDGHAQDGSYALKALELAGEPGARCLTFNLEARSSYFDAARSYLDDLVTRARTGGFTVDELLQRVADEAHDTRFWLLIYESGSNDATG